MAVEVVTFGCRLNFYESELIKKSANQAGLKDTIIFNGCAVTNEAERQLKQSIRKAKRDKPNAKIVVTGCAAQLNPEKYAAMSQVDNVIGNEHKTVANSYMQLETEKIITNDIMSVKETALHLVERLEGKARAFLQVQNGCNHRCTFCTIPYARGNGRSVPIAQIVKQAQLMLDNGYNEIVLTGVDITDYGSDLPGKPKLGEMVKRLLTLLPELKRLRLSSIDVAEIDEQLMELIKYEQRLMPHLHLSLQAGDDMILKRMKRRHRREQVREFCQEVRNIRKDVVFGADIIAGFPTETDEMFENTYDLIQDIKIAHLHVFPYSERENTPAARMPQVEKKVRKQRALKLRQLGESLLQKHYKIQIGNIIEGIVEKEGMARAKDFSLITFEGALPVGEIFSFKINEISDHLVGKAL